uniref:Uncharacterized protein n=1 Tax=Nonomuraea gerenzanensis TaxID=93944 RepID=A0A1M4EQQ1_9ACTN|nr:hypothetical protein BN4615_P10449 [Nonomuraea gerenzanensis]
MLEPKPEPVQAVPEPSPAPGSPAREAMRKGWLDALQLWLGLATGTIALILSIINWVTLNRDPEVSLSLPSILRIAQGDNVWLYLQPTFTTIRKTETTDYITGMELRVRPPAGSGAAPTLVWDETGTWVYDSKTQEADYSYQSDPQPMLVSQDTPQSPTILFEATGWQFRPGRYELELRATRSSTDTPLAATFCLDITADDDAAFAQEGQYRWIGFQRTRTGSASSPAKACYRS